MDGRMDTWIDEWIHMIDIHWDTDNFVIRDFFCNQFVHVTYYRNYVSTYLLVVEWYW